MKESLTPQLLTSTAQPSAKRTVACTRIKQSAPASPD